MASLRALQGDKTRLAALHGHAGCPALADFVFPEGTGKGRLEIGEFSTCPPWHPTQGLPPPARCTAEHCETQAPHFHWQHPRCRSAPPGAAVAFPPSQAGSILLPFPDELTGMSHGAGEWEEDILRAAPNSYSAFPATCFDNSQPVVEPAWVLLRQFHFCLGWPAPRHTGGSVPHS